jgi:signal transduction histidine kinase
VFGEGLVYVRADGGVERIAMREGLPSPTVDRLFQDRSGNVWVGYHRGSLVKIRRRLFQTLGQAEGLRATVVNSVCEDQAGAIWIGVAGSTITRWQNGTSTNFDLSPYGNRNSVAAPDRDGRLWLGTFGGGLLVREAGRFRQVVTPDQLGSDTLIRLVQPARDGRVWFATKAGLYSYRDGAVTNVLATTPDSFVTDLAADERGGLWAGTMRRQLLRYDGNTFVPVAMSQPLPNRILALRAGADNRIWLGTLHAGLFCWQNDRLTSFRADGFPIDTVYGILEDDSGILWLATNLGIVCVAKAALDQIAVNPRVMIPYRIFDRSAGLLTIAASTEFKPSCWRGQDGRLWFAMANGVASVQPRDIPTRSQPPTVLIEELSVAGQLWAGHPAYRSDTSPVPIGPGRRDLEFQFTALDFSAPESLRFSYKLDGLDTQWSKISGDRLAVYRSVPPGGYTFRVQARNSDGVWSERDATLAVTVLPFYWETTWFRFTAMAMTLGFFGGVLALGLRWRHRRELEQTAHREAVARERARIAQDLHDDLGAGLTEINIASTLAEAPATSHDETRQYAQEIGVRSREMAAALDEIVWAVNPHNDTVQSLASYITQYAESFLRTVGLPCRFDIPNDLPAAPLTAVQRHSLFLVIKEALNNVVRHAAATEIRLTMRVLNGWLTVTVADNGKGLPAGAPRENANGLRNMQDRLAKLDGRCTVTSVPAQGTKVNFQLPLTVQEHTS